jgi:hypothetical protein
MMDAARKLGSSHFRLFEIARAEGMLDDNNRPTRLATERGLFLPRTIRANDGTREFTRASATVTPAGIQWLNVRLYGEDQAAYLAGISTRALGKLLAAAGACVHEGANGNGTVTDETLTALADALDGARSELEEDHT